MFARVAAFTLLTLLLTGQVMTMTIGRRQIPAEQAVKSPAGTIEPYSRRQNPEEQSVSRRQIPTEDPVKSPAGIIVPYSRRQIPTENPV